MGRYFNGANSDTIIIADWWPDNAALHDYTEVGIRVVLKHDSANDNQLIIRGGPLSVNRLGNLGWLFGTALIYDQYAGTGYAGQINLIWNAGGSVSMGAYANLAGSPGDRIPSDVDYTYTGISYKGGSGNYTFHADGSTSPGTGPVTAGVGGNIVTSAGRPWYFFTDTGSASNNNGNIIGAKNLVINPKDGFYGTLESIETWIVRGDGATWSRTKTFTGGSSDHSTFDPLVITPDSFSYFDTRRRLGATSTTTGSFDTRRFMYKEITSYHDTRRCFIAATVRIPVDTLR